MTRGRCGSLFLHRVTLHSLHLAGFPGAQGAEHVLDRRRLPPELSDDCNTGDARIPRSQKQILPGLADRMRAHILPRYSCLVRMVHLGDEQS